MQGDGGSEEAWTWGRWRVERAGMVKEGHHGDRLPRAPPCSDICPEGFGGYCKGVLEQTKMKIHYFVHVLDNHVRGICKGLVLFFFPKYVQGVNGNDEDVFDDLMPLLHCDTVAL